MTRLMFILALLSIAAPCAADVTYPARIGEREFILDEADLIDEADEDVIRRLCDALLTDRQIPIIIVTIRAQSEYGAGGQSIERYAHDLFDEWGIGSPEYNYGVLLLVAKKDRKARIELGADWGREHDDAAQKVMDRMIITNFKKGEFSTGILAGVHGLDKMARGEDFPGSPLTDAFREGGGLIQEIISGFSMACLFWIAAPFLIILSMFGRRHYGGFGGGGFGGGSFGGGFSGGGGATGSW